MKVKKDVSTYYIIIGAVIGAVVFILFLLKFSRAIESIIHLILGRNPYQMTDSLYMLKWLLFGAFQLFLGMVFVFTGMFLALCITKNYNRLRMGKNIRNILISLSIAPIAFFLFSIIGIWFNHKIYKILGNASLMLGAGFDEGLVGFFLSLFIANFKQYPKGKIKIVLAGTITGWGCSSLIFNAFAILNVIGNDLRKLVKNAQMPLTILCVGIAVILMERRVNHQLEKMQNDEGLRNQSNES